MSTNNVIDDPLLAGLSRLSTSRNRPQVNIQIDRKTQTVSSQQPPPKSSAPSSASPAASAEHPRREQVDPARRATNAGGLSAFSSNAEHSSSSPRHFRRSTSDASSQQASDSFSKHGSTQFEQPSQHLRPTVKPLIPLHRSDTCELIERTTGLGRPSDGDPSGAERLLQLIRNGSLPPHTVLEYIVAGSGPNEVKVNARVLWLMHYLMVHGGPDMVPEAVQPFRKRNAPALRLVLAVLRSFGYIEETDALDVLQDDEKVRAMTLSTDRNNVPTDSLQRSWGEKTLEAAAVETYAIALGRKVWFHYRYKVVEVNYSLDRFYRAWHVENDCDPAIHTKNEEVVKMTISRGALQDMCMLVRVMTAAAWRLQRGRVPYDISLLALADACNAYSYALYLRKKVEPGEDEHFTLELQRGKLAVLLRKWEQREGMGLELLRSHLDQRVYNMILNANAAIVRPESRHRREIEIEVTSFEALHETFAYLRHRGTSAVG